MKQKFYLFISIFFLINAAEASERPRFVRIRCVSGEQAASEDIVVDELTANLDWVGNGDMPGIDGYQGPMTIHSNDPEKPVAIVTVKSGIDVSTGIDHGNTLWGHLEEDYTLAGYSDLLSRVGVKRIATLKVETSKKWQRKFQLICERII